MGNLSFGSSQANGDYHDHLGTKTGADAHDTPADVIVHHATGSVAADGEPQPAAALRRHSRPE